MTSLLKYFTKELQKFHKAQKQSQNNRNALARATTKISQQNILSIVITLITNVNVVSILISPLVLLLLFVAQIAIVS